MSLRYLHRCSRDSIGRWAGIGLKTRESRAGSKESAAEWAGFGGEWSRSATARYLLSSKSKRSLPVILEATAMAAAKKRKDPD